MEAATVMASLHFASRAYALEGHSPEVILGNLAKIIRIDQTEPGPPVGINAHVKYPQASFPFPAGSTLIAYTDGLIERRGESLDAGLMRLRKVVANVGGSSVDELLGAMHAELTNGNADDDIALIGLRCRI